MKFYLFGLVTGVIVFLVLSKFIITHLPVYERNIFGLYSETEISLKNFIECNENLKLDDVQFVVGPTSDGYKLMLSSEVDSKRLSEIREIISSWLIEEGHTSDY